MKIKVCGMRYPENVQALSRLSPDFMGFIFYPLSKRYVGEAISDELQKAIAPGIPMVGVFVDEPLESLLVKASVNRLELVQLHGFESPGYCREAAAAGLTLIKAFSVDHDFDFAEVKPYESFCSYFLFDTATTLRGGSGQKFEWSLLNRYTGDRPFFLSGGIGAEDIEAIRQIEHPQLFAIDVNSGFELEPGVKQIPLLQNFMERLRKPEGQIHE